MITCPDCGYRFTTFSDPDQVELWTPTSTDTRGSTSSVTSATSALHTSSDSASRVQDSRPVSSITRTVTRHCPKCERRTPHVTSLEADRLICTQCASTTEVLCDASMPYSSASDCSSSPAVSGPSSR